MRSWVIGSRADCDVVVDSPLASGRHCQLTAEFRRLRARRPGIDQRHLRRRQPNHCGDRASRPPSRSRSVRPWRCPGRPNWSKFVRIGRIEGNDIVLDDPRVSSQHARLMIVGRFRCLDRGSRFIERNLSEFSRTARDAADAALEIRTRSISEVWRFRPLDCWPACSKPTAPAPRQRPASANRSQRATRAAGRSRNRPSGLRGNRWLVVALAQVPLLAILDCRYRRSSRVRRHRGKLEIGRAGDRRDDLRPGQSRQCGSVAPLPSRRWLVGYGRCASEEVDSDRFLDLRPDRGSAFFASVCALGCALLLAIVYWGTGLKGPWLAHGGRAGDGIARGAATRSLDFYRGQKLAGSSRRF